MVNFTALDPRAPVQRIPGARAHVDSVRGFVWPADLVEDLIVMLPSSVTSSQVDDVLRSILLGR